MKSFFLVYGTGETICSGTFRRFGKVLTPKCLYLQSRHYFADSCTDDTVTVRVR